MSTALSRVQVGHIALPARVSRQPARVASGLAEMHQNPIDVDVAPVGRSSSVLPAGIPTMIGTSTHPLNADSGSAHVQSLLHRRSHRRPRSVSQGLAGFSPPSHRDGETDAQVPESLASLRNAASFAPSISPHSSTVVNTPVSPSIASSHRLDTPALERARDHATPIGDLSDSATTRNASNQSDISVQEARTSTLPNKHIDCQDTAEQPQPHRPLPQQGGPKYAHYEFKTAYTPTDTEHMRPEGQSKPQGRAKPFPAPPPTFKVTGIRVTILVAIGILLLTMVIAWILVAYYMWNAMASPGPRSKDRDPELGEEPERKSSPQATPDRPFVRARL